MERCPVCNEYPDYCPGHGEIGDPEGAKTLVEHDDGWHHNCHPWSECRRAD